MSLPSRRAGQDRSSCRFIQAVQAPAPSLDPTYLVWEPASVEANIRRYQASDREAVVELSVRAWAPVFRSMKRILGPEISVRLHGADWGEYQATEVGTSLDDPDTEVWVAEEDGIAGFVALKVLDSQRQIGEVWMLAVDPEHQKRGLGTRLTTFATDRLREAGMRVAMIGTGGDPGHAPARRVYEKAQYTLMPMAQYWMAL